jgi:peptidoglycan/xylan/chitin deacetylase (PgdA/CDA1 family)
MSGKAITFHYIDSYKPTWPFHYYLDVGDFVRLVDFLEATGGIVTRDEWEKYLDGQDLPPNKTLLTFDDGLKCQYDNVFPVLKTKKLWGMFFVAGNPLVYGVPLDAHLIHFIGANLKPEQLKGITEELDVEAQTEIYADKTYQLQNGVDEFTKFKRYFNYVCHPDDRTIFLQQIADRFLLEFPFESFYMSEKEISEMSGYGFLFGGHSMSHRLLGTLSRAEQFKEIADSQGLMSAITKDETKGFCFPYGGHGAWNGHTTNILQSVGCKFAFTTDEGTLPDIVSNEMRLPRIDCNQMKYGRASGGYK